ncbi:MAG TPA: hypothetical protein QF776_10190 [Acidimicrobiales bacterium]|jgi:hypothetical protein|nr:hypothetical protein [Acidimicrobiales bacterium]HJM29003.1 hypothetical protein [Acidimicrobiales bacterium]HJM98525.1 hypothetical protein [Acidimicrobiales bacterium]
MKVTRWPAFCLFAALIIAAIAMEDNNETTPKEQIFERNQALLVGEDTDLSATWYCVSGTVGGSGIADHEILIGNPSNSPANSTIIVIPVLAPKQLTTDDGVMGGDEKPETLQLTSVTTEITTPERSMTSITLSEIEGVNGEYAAAFIQSDVGSLIVEHRLSGLVGTSQAPCASNASVEWNFASGTTRTGVREIISVFNPFPDNAVLDIAFTADGRTRRPEAYSGLVLPPGNLLPIDITDVVTLAATVGARVETRIGRIIAERMILFGDEFQPLGLSTEIGSPSLSQLWAFPGGFDTDFPSSVVIYNPSTSSEAEVDVEIILDIETGSYIEPISIRIKPGSSEEVLFGQRDENTEETYALDASSRIPRGIPYWVVVRSLNKVPIVSERSIISSPNSSKTSGSNLGTDFSGREHFAIATNGEGELAILHPADDRLTLVHIYAYSQGQVYESQVFEVSAKSRKIIDLRQLGIPNNSVLRIVSSEPVSIERYLGSEVEGEWSRLPVAGSSLVQLEIEPPNYE